MADRTGIDWDDVLFFVLAAALPWVIAGANDFSGGYLVLAVAITGLAAVVASFRIAVWLFRRRSTARTE